MTNFEKIKADIQSPGGLARIMSNCQECWSCIASDFCEEEKNDGVECYLVLKRYLSMEVEE